jgi:hypothetical protein
MALTPQALHASYLDEYVLQLRASLDGTKPGKQAEAGSNRMREGRST